MNIETTLWFNMKRRRPLKYKLYYEFKQNQESFNTVITLHILQGLAGERVYSDVKTSVLNNDKRTMMVLYRSPGQTDLHIYC